uniref:Ovule protein n=1 Tax=Parascaris univalens TaxID=6257 RepID=A0A914ZWZ2_PARUN
VHLAHPVDFFREAPSLFVIRIRIFHIPFLTCSISLGNSRSKRHEERSFTLTLGQLVISYHQVVEDDEARKKMERKRGGCILVNVVLPFNEFEWDRITFVTFLCLLT